MRGMSCVADYRQMYWTLFHEITATLEKLQTAQQNTEEMYMNAHDVPLRVHKVTARLLMAYLKGDATEPMTRPALICHVCNDVGAFGAGFAKAVAAKWPYVAHQYKTWHQQEDAGTLLLGQVQVLEAEQGIWVANMVAQHGLRSRANPIPLNYSALMNCLDYVAEWALKRSMPIHMPRIGTGYAGGEWDKIEPLVRKRLYEKGLCVYIYDLDAPKSG